MAFKIQIYAASYLHNSESTIRVEMLMVFSLEPRLLANAPDDLELPSLRLFMNISGQPGQIGCVCQCSLQTASLSSSGCGLS